MRWYFLCCKISLLIVIRVNTCTPWSIIPLFLNPYLAASSFLWSFGGKKENPLQRKARHCLAIWSVLKEFDIFMKMYFCPTISESKDHLHMCLSEIAQARQVSPVCEIKLAAVFIDLSIQKKKKKKGVQMLFSFSRTSDDLGWLPADFSPVPRLDDRPALKSSKLILTTWVWHSTLWSVLRRKSRQLRRLSKSLCPGETCTDHVSR